jgi:dynein heavy chain
MGVEFPDEKTVYDWYWNQEDKKWESWFATVPEYSVDIKLPYNEIVVPTQDSIRMKYLLKTLIVNMKHVLTPGPTGTGKTVYIQELTTFEMSEEYQTLKMTFSAQTSANQTQDFIDDKCEKRRMRVYGPPNGKRFIIFVDDMNMPAREEYGAQPPIELLRQFADHGGWYDRKSKEKPFNRLVDIILVASMGPPGGGRSVVTQRMQRQFNIISYTDMQFEAITTIFKTILDAFYYNFTAEVKKAIDPLIEIQLEVYD